MRQGSNSSGMHTIWKTGERPLFYDDTFPPSPNDIDEVYCDLDTFGGGWTLIAFSDPSGNWPTIDYNFNPRRTSAALDGMAYSPEWDRDHSFYRLFDTNGIHEDWIMFRAGDNSAYCAFVREDILETSLLGLLRPTTILGSSNVGLKHGEKTNHMFTGNSEKAHPLVGCEGSYEQNQARLLWAENGAGLGISWKNRHGGIGVFVRSADDAPPHPVLVRIADLNHSQVQIVFDEPIVDSNGWVQPNIQDFQVFMGPWQSKNITRYTHLNATFMVNGTIMLPVSSSGSVVSYVNASNLTLTLQEWYEYQELGYNIFNGTYVEASVLGNVTTTETQRSSKGELISASLTADGNLTLEMSEPIPYGVGINVEYWKSEPFNSRYTRNIGDVYHNQVISFGPKEGDNQINPSLQKAMIKDASPHILNMTFTGRLERSPQVKDFNVSVDNQSVPIRSVHIDDDGRVIIELYKYHTTIWRPWSASNHSIYDPMQPIDVSYYKSSLPRNITDINTIVHNWPAYVERRSLIGAIESTHIADGNNRAVSTFEKLTVHNYLHDTTSPIYRTSFVYDSTPNIIILEFTELSLPKICDLHCGQPHFDDFTVIVNGFTIPNHQTHVYIPSNEGKLHIHLLNYTVTYQQVVDITYRPSNTHSERRVKDMYGNELKYFNNKIVNNLVNPAPRVALISDLRHNVLSVYFTGTGANAGNLSVDDWTVWYEKDQYGTATLGFCTDLVHPLDKSIWRDDSNETCTTFESMAHTTSGRKESYCSQYGHIVPKIGAQSANVACCTCGGGTYDIQLLDARVVRHPTMGRVDLLLPREIINGESLVVKYTKHSNDVSRHVGGWDGLYTNSWERLVVENNVWPTLIKAIVRNDNTSMITLMFTGRGIVRGRSILSEFVITLEDCRLCTLNWHLPIKTIVSPILVQRVDLSNTNLGHFSPSVGRSAHKRTINPNYGHVNLTLGIPIRHYHQIYVNYHSRWDASAPRRDDTIAPLHDCSGVYSDLFDQCTSQNQFRQIFSTVRHLPLRNFTRFHVLNQVYEILGQHTLQYVQERREFGYSAISEPLLDMYWERTNVTAQYLSVLLITPLGQMLPASSKNEHCNSGSSRTGTHLSPIVSTNLQTHPQSQQIGSYAHQYQMIPGCRNQPTIQNGCMNGTLTISTPTRPGDYRIQLWTLTNATIGTYNELMRRSFGNHIDPDVVDANVLRTNYTIHRCYQNSAAAGAVQPNDISLLSFLDLTLFELLVDVPLHVQFTVNIKVPLFRVRKRQRTNDILNPFVPIHMNLREGGIAQTYTVEMSTNPIWVTSSTTDRKAQQEEEDVGFGRSLISAGKKGGSITIQIIDTCSEQTSDKDAEIERLSINNQASTVIKIVINGTMEVPLTNWTTKHAPMVVRHFDIKTYDNVEQNIEQKCQLIHFITPTNGVYNKWDVALVLGSRDRVEWERVATDVEDDVSSTTSTQRHYPSGTLPNTMPTIKLPIHLSDDENQWITHSNARLLGWCFVGLFLVSMLVRVSSTLYWRSFDAFDLRDLNNEAHNRCLEVAVAGTRHPAALLGSHRFYAGSCIWTLLSAIQSFSVLGRLRCVTDRATIVYSLIDTAFSSFTLMSDSMIHVLNYWQMPLRNSIQRGHIYSNMTYVKDGVRRDVGYDGNYFNYSPMNSNNQTTTAEISRLIDGQARSYDLFRTIESSLTTMSISVALFVVAMLMWLLIYSCVRVRVKYLIRKLRLIRERSRPKAMTSEKIVSTTKKATTAEALRALRKELYQIEMYEQYILADLKRKRKKSALQLNTPEGLDYIRIARLHDIVRFSSLSMIVLFILFQGLSFSALSFTLTMVVIKNIDNSSEVPVFDATYYWVAIGFSVLMSLIWLLTWLFFVYWVPRATQFARVSIQTSLEEANALKFGIRERQQAVRTTSHLRGRWYVTKHDRNLLRKCGWLLDTVVKHNYWDKEDGIRVGGTIITNIPTKDAVILKEEENKLFQNYPSMWPVYEMLYQLSIAAIAGGLTHIDRTGVTQLLSMLSVCVVHLFCCMISWPKNIRNANYFLVITSSFRCLFLFFTLFLYVESFGDSSRFYVEILMAVTIICAVLPPFLIELHASGLQLYDVVRIIEKSLSKADEDLVIRPSCQKRAQHYWKKNCRLNRCCMKVFSCCCVEDYMMASTPAVLSKNAGVDEDSEDDDDEENEKKTKNIIVVEIDPMLNAEKPTAEILRLKKELEKEGYSTVPRKMHGHL
jgi:hypothetical protein